MSYELIIGGEQVYMAQDSDFPISLIRQGPSAADPVRRAADRTFTVKIVNDDNAKRALASAHRIDAVATFQRFSAVGGSRIYGGGELLLEGVFVLTGITESEIEGFFAATTASFGEVLSGRKLTDLPLPSLQFRGTLTQIEINQAFRAAWAAGTQGDFAPRVFFPLVIFGFNFLPNYWGADTNRVLSSSPFQGEWGTTVNLPASRPILDENSYAVDIASIGHIDWRAVPPAFLFVWVVRAIIEAAGYTAQGAFFANPFALQAVLLPCVDPHWNWVDLATGAWEGPEANAVSIKQVFARGFSVYTSFKWATFPSSFDRAWRTAINHPFHPDWNGDSFDPQKWWAAARLFRTNTQVRDFAHAKRNSPFWTCPADGRYRFRIQVDIEAFDMPAGYPADGSKAAIGITRCPDGEIPEFLDGNWMAGGPGNEGWGNVIAIQELTAMGTVVLEGEADVTRGDAVVCWVGATHWASGEDDTGYFINPSSTPAPPEPAIPSSSFTTDRTVFYRDPRFDVLYLAAPDGSRFPADVQLRPARSLPAMSQAEFLTAVRTLFNLTFQVDESRKTFTLDFVQDVFSDDRKLVDLTDNVVWNSRNIKPPDASAAYRFEWAVDGQDYAASRMPRGDYRLNTGLATGTEQVVNANPLTRAAVERFSVLEANGNFANPEWVEVDSAELPRIASRDAWVSPVNTIDPDGQAWSPKVVNLVLVQSWFVPPVARIFDLALPLGQRDTWAEWDVQMQFDATELAWEPLSQRVYQEWLKISAAGHTLEVDAYISAGEFKQLMPSATVVIDGVRYGLIELRGFNPAKRASRVRLRLSRK